MRKLFQAKEKINGKIQCWEGNPLVAVETIYHRNCMTKFRLKSSTKKIRGKPVNVELLESFESVCAWLEKYGDCDLHTVQELQEKIKQKRNGEVY